MWWPACSSPSHLHQTYQLLLDVCRLEVELPHQKVLDHRKVRTRVKEFESTNKPALDVNTLNENMVFIPSLSRMAILLSVIAITLASDNG
jgi:hypothetical protein